MTYTIWDIETAPLPLSEVIMPEFEASKVLKDPEKIQADIDKQKKAWESKLALSPMTGHILAIGYSTVSDEGGGELVQLVDQKTMSEGELIQDFFKRIEIGSFIGFNTHSFDIPFIVKRAWHHNLKVPKQLLGRYMPETQIDLMKIWLMGSYDKTGSSLNAIAQFFDLGSKEHTGEYYSQVFESDYEKAREYLINDLRLTYKVAQRIGVV